MYDVTSINITVTLADGSQAYHGGWEMFVEHMATHQRDDANFDEVYDAAKYTVSDVEDPTQRFDCDHNAIAYLAEVITTGIEIGMMQL